MLLKHLPHSGLRFCTDHLHRPLLPFLMRNVCSMSSLSRPFTAYIHTTIFQQLTPTSDQPTVPVFKLLFKFSQKHLNTFSQAIPHVLTQAAPSFALLFFKILLEKNKINSFFMMLRGLSSQLLRFCLHHDPELSADQFCTATP